MKKFIIILVLAVSLFAGIVQASDREVPPEVPPCPEEYEDGLKP